VNGELVRMQFMIHLQINGQPFELQVPGRMPLLWVLRDCLGLTGTKFGCGQGLCGACTIHVNGQASRACQLPVENLVGAAITTIEGLAQNSSHPLQKAWVENQVPQWLLPIWSAHECGSTPPKQASTH
jgi:isoquinoline 1-oxidoreductase subunit alpha